MSSKFVVALCLLASVAEAAPPSDPKNYVFIGPTEEKNWTDARKLPGLAPWLACRGSDKWPACEKSLETARAAMAAASLVLVGTEPRFATMTGQQRLARFEAPSDRCLKGHLRRLAALVKAGRCFARVTGDKPETLPNGDRLEKVVQTLLETNQRDEEMSVAMVVLRDAVRGFKGGTYSDQGLALRCRDEFEGVFAYAGRFGSFGKVTWVEPGEEPIPKDGSAMCKLLPWESPEKP